MHPGKTAPRVHPFDIQRVHGTTREILSERFERDERVVLGPLAARPYRSLVLLPDPAPPLAPRRRAER